MLQSALTNIVSFLQLGGPVVVVLCTLSVIALAIILVKLTQFWLSGVGRHKRAREITALWQAGRCADAHAVAAARARQALPRLLNTAMRLMVAAPGTRPEEQLARLASHILHDLQRGFRALDAIAQIAPLLGLFGTILGMIDAFQGLQSAGAAVDPSALAGGIWTALLTTAVGLAVAMPVSLTLTWLETMLDNERVAMEQLTAIILDTSSRPNTPENEQAIQATGPAAAGAEAYAY